MKTLAITHLGLDIRNTKVKVVSLLSHGKGEAMVHICHRKYE
jgi:Tfp pilus assembly PilM family ATPase